MICSLIHAANINELVRNLFVVWHESSDEWFEKFDNWQTFAGSGYEEVCKKTAELAMELGIITAGDSGNAAVYFEMVNVHTKLRFYFDKLYGPGGSRK
jgi:hypothetical protein